MTYSATSHASQYATTLAHARAQWKRSAHTGIVYSERKNSVQAYRQITPSHVDQDASLTMHSIAGVEELRKATDELGIIYWVCGNNLSEEAVEAIVDEFVCLARRHRGAHLRLEITDRFDGTSNCPQGLSRIPPMKATYEHTATTSLAGG